MRLVPCVASETRLATDIGLLTVRELEQASRQIRLSTDNRISAVQGGRVVLKVRRGITMHYAGPVFKTQMSLPLYSLATEHGFEIMATGNMEFFTPEGPVALDHLAMGDRVLVQSGAGVWNAPDSSVEFDGETTGWTMGLKEPGIISHVPEVLWRASRSTVFDFLRAFFTAQRSRITTFGGVLSLGTKKLAQELQLLLLNEGIMTRIRRTHAFEALILEDHNRQRFDALFPEVLPKSGRETMESIMASILQEHFHTRVLSMTPAAQAEVYGATEPVTQSMIANGFVIATTARGSHA